MADADFSDILGINVENLKEGARVYKMNRGIGCVLCDYSGYTTNFKGKAVMCSCEKDRFFRKLYRQSNVPQIFFGKTLDDWDTRTDSLGRDLGTEEQVSQKVITLLKFFEKHFSRICQGDSPTIKHTGHIVAKLHSILFDGKSGSGKTFIASAMVQSALRKNLTSKYYEWSDLISVLTDFDKKEEFENINEEFKNLDFIAIDGIEQYPYTHPHFIQNLDRLAKSRLNSGKPVFLMVLGSTSNISTGSGWNSLIRNCLTIRLPHIR